MASYGMVEGLTGVRDDAVDEALYIDSKIGDFTGFLSAATGFGNISLHQGKPRLEVVYEKIAPKRVVISGREVKA